VSPTRVQQLGLLVLASLLILYALMRLL